MQLKSRLFATMSSTVIMALLTGCASSPSSIKTFEDPAYADASFRKILIIGVAGSYDNRARWERLMASRISAQGASASAYHSVVGGNQAIDRDAIINAVRANNFDAVLLTRVQSQSADVNVKRGASSAQVTRMDERPVDFFRYDYEVLNNPDTINIETKVVLSTELFSASDEKRIWAIESTVSNKKHVDYLIEDAIEMVIKELNKDRLIGRQAP